MRYGTATEVAIKGKQIETPPSVPSWMFCFRRVLLRFFTQSPPSNHEMALSSSLPLSRTTSRTRRTTTHSSSSALPSPHPEATPSPANRPRALPANLSAAPSPSVAQKRRRSIRAAPSSAPLPAPLLADDDDNNSDPPRQIRCRRKSSRLLALRSAASASTAAADAAEHDDANIVHDALSLPTRRRINNNGARAAHTQPAPEQENNNDHSSPSSSRKRKRRLPLVPTLARGAESAVNATFALTRRLLGVPTAQGSSRHSARLANKRELLCIEKSCASFSLTLVPTTEDDFGGKDDMGLMSRNKRRKTNSVKSRTSSAKQLTSDAQDASAHPPTQDRVSVEADSDASDDTLVNVPVHDLTPDKDQGLEVVELAMDMISDADSMAVDTAPQQSHPFPDLILESQQPSSKPVLALASTSTTPVIVVSLVPAHVSYGCPRELDSQPFSKTLCGSLTYFPGELQDRAFHGFESGEKNPGSPLEISFVKRVTLYMVAVGLGNLIAAKQDAALSRWEAERAASKLAVYRANISTGEAHRVVLKQRISDRIWRDARAAYFAEQARLGERVDNAGDIDSEMQNDVSDILFGPSLAPPTPQNSLDQQGQENIEMDCIPSPSPTADSWSTAPATTSLENDSFSTAFNDDPIFLTAPPITVPSSPGAFPVQSTIASSSKTIFLDAPPGEFESVVETYVYLDDSDSDSSDSGYSDSSWHDGPRRSSREKGIRLRRTVARRLWHHVQYQDPTASFPPSHYQYWNPELRYQQRRRQRGAPPLYPSKLRVSYVVVDRASDDREEDIGAEGAETRIDTAACSEGHPSDMRSPASPLSSFSSSIMTSPPSPTLALNGNLDALDGFPSEKLKGHVETGEMVLDGRFEPLASSEFRENVKAAEAAVERVFPRQHVQNRREMQRRSELSMWKTAVFSRMGDLCMTFGTENVQARIDYEAQLLSSYPCSTFSGGFDDRGSDFSTTPSSTPSPAMEQCMDDEEDSAMDSGGAQFEDLPRSACTFDEDMLSDADGDFEIDDEYEGLQGLTETGHAEEHLSESVTMDCDVDMEENGSDGTSDSSTDGYDSDGGMFEMRDYEFKVDIDVDVNGGAQQLDSAGAVEGMEFEFTVADYSPSSPSSPSPTPSPTGSSFPACDASSASSLLDTTFSADASSFEFPASSSASGSGSYATADGSAIRRPFAPFVPLSRFPVHCLRDSMQPVRGLGTPDGGAGRKEWRRAAFGWAPSDVVFGVDAGYAAASGPPPPTSMSTPLIGASIPTTPPSALLGIFGYGVDMGGYVNAVSSPSPSPSPAMISTSSTLECAMMDSVSASGVL